LGQQGFLFAEGALGVLQRGDVFDLRNEADDPARRVALRDELTTYPTPTAASGADEIVIILRLCT